ncbi:MAG: UPF0755 protein [Woeseiaceae bacterium]
MLHLNRILKILLPLLAIALLVVAITGWQVRGFLTSAVSVPQQGVAFEIRPGAAFAEVSENLADLGVIERSDYFRWYARITGKAAAVHAGEYQIAAGMTPVQLLDKFVSGEVQLYSFTIVEGWTYRELLAAVNASDVVEPSISYEDWPALLQLLGSDIDHPEGLFLPETYRFPKGTTDVELLKQAYQLMQDTLAAEWAGRDVNLPITSPYEALILASIIEKETALASERPQISGVFVRRMRQRMRLQTDPTVIYGIGIEFNGNLTRNDLRTDTPYNTYTRSGLPPTPIALPGKAAINAAVHPADGSEVYFVATGLGDGSHKFSDTKEQHDAAVQEYLKRQRAARLNQTGQ